MEGAGLVPFILKRKDKYVTPNDRKLKNSKIWNFLIALERSWNYNDKDIDWPLDCRRVPDGDALPTAFAEILMPFCRNRRGAEERKERPRLSIE